MRRRTVLQWLTSFGSVIRGWSQVQSFPGAQGATLRALAAIVLPGTLGRAGTDQIAGQFEAYVRDYRAGADTDHGYGVTRVRPKGPSPAPEYLRQLAALPVPLTREAVESTIEKQQVKEMPRLPDGRSVIADLMSFYFRSAEANDLCYQAAIERDTCRGLAGSNQEPAPLSGKKVKA